MRDSATPARDAPLRRLAFLGLVFVAAILSCGRDVTGPDGARFARGISWNTIYPQVLRSVGGASSGVVDFNRVHVVLHHSDGTIALDTTIAFPSGADSLTVSLTVALLNNAPASGEPMKLNLGYVNAAGDTVFKGGPIALTAAPPPAHGGVNPPVQVPVAYTGPGASATAVVIAPRIDTVAGGAGFTFTAIAKGAAGDTLAGTPVIWTSLDPTIATITAPAAGTGVALNMRGTAHILAQLLTGATDTAQLVVTLPASQIVKSSGDAQAGTTGVALALPIVAKVAASDGVGIAGTTVTFAVATGGGSVTPTSAVSDVNGLVTTNWTLGATVGAQSVTATAGTLTGSPLTFTATAASGGAGLRTWTGATSTAWATASNWSPAVVPGSGDSVFVPLTSTLPTLSSSTTIKSLTLASSALLTFTSGTLTLTGSLDATGGIVGAGTVALNSPTAATLKGTITTSVQVAGLYTVTGALAANGLQLTNSASLDVNGQTVVVAAGGISTASTATIVMTQAAGILGTTGPASFGGGDETGKLTAGTLSVGGNFAEGGGNAAAFNAGPAFTLLLSASAATTLSIADVATSPLGNLAISNAAGVTTLTAFTANNVTIATGALTGTLGATITGTLTDPSAHWAAGNISFTTSTTPVSASTPSISPASQITFNNNPSILAGNLVLSGIVNVLGNLTINGHTLTVNGNLATSGSGQLTMNNAADIVNVTGNVTFGSTGAGGPMSAGTLNLAGNFNQSGNAQSFSSSGTNTIVLNGVLVQGVTFGSPDVGYTASCASSCFQNFTVSKASGTVTFASAAKVIGNFTNGSGTAITAPATNGSLIVAGNAAFGPGSTLHHVGVGTSTYSKGAGTAIDSVSYFGAAQAYNPATLGEAYSEIRGTANWTAPGTLTGQMVLSGTGQLNVATSAVVTGNFTSSGTSTLKMTTNATDTLAIGGVATFAGGPTTGLLTTGNLVISGASISVTGQAIDASGTYTTTFNATSGTQTLGWTSPLAGKGYNNLTLRGAAQRQFSGNQTVAGNMLIAATSGNVNGSYTLTFGGNIADSTAARNAWNGSSLVVMTGTPTVLPRNFGVNTLTFSGGTVSLADSLKGVGFMVVDGASAHLKLNGHYVGLTANFTTQNGGVLEMTNTHDTLDVAGGATFNGGNTSGLLKNGYINVGSPGFTQGTNATAFVADSTLRVSIGRGNGTQITFANPGFGATLSHFGELMIGDGSTHTLNSDVYVQGQLTTAAGVQFPVTSANHLIAAQGANATHLYLTNTRLLLQDGSRIATLTDLQFLSMDPTVTQFEVQRTGTANTGDFAATLSAPIFNTAPTSGLYLKATDTDGATPFVTINVATPSPLSSSGFATVAAGAIINGWPANATATALKTGNWSDPTAWSTGLVPTTAENVVIPSPFNVTLTGSSFAHNLTVNANSTLTMGANTLTVSGTPTTTGGVTTCTADNFIFTGTVSLAGSWCGIRVTGTTTLSGITSVSGLATVASGTLVLNNQTLIAGSFQTTGGAAGGVLNMQHAFDTLKVIGTATFQGGTETGLLTAGELAVQGNFAVGTGAMFAASGTHTTLFSDSLGTQTIGWTTPVANVGFNNVLFSHSQARQFTSDAYIGGTVQIFSNDTVGTTAFISGAHRITLGGTNQGILDQALGGAWRVGTTVFAMPGASLTTALFSSMSQVDTTVYAGGGTFKVLTGTQTTKNVIVDNNTTLNLNGFLLNTQGNSFTTQNGGMLQMNTSASDSLAAGHVYFNGGSTAGLLAGGGMSLTGLYQGLTPAFATVPTANALAFSPNAGLRTYFTGTAATPDTVAFANPGTGAAGSHFYYLQDRLPGAAGPPPPVVLRSDIFVDSLLQADVIAAIYNSDALSSTVRAITTKGFSNTGTVGVTLNGVALNLTQGTAPFVYFSSVTWDKFPANYTGVAFTQQRTTAGPIFNLITYTNLTFGTTGEFATNLGSANMVFGTGVSNPGCASKTLAINQSCK